MLNIARMIALTRPNGAIPALSGGKMRRTTSGADQAATSSARADLANDDHAARDGVHRMIRRRTVLLGTAAALVAVRAAFAQPQPSVPRIAYVKNGIPDDDDEDYRRALIDLGYVIGETIVIEYFYLASWDELPDVVPRVLAGEPDVVVARGTLAAQAFKQATSTVPIVFTNVSDAVAIGLVASLARPGGNLTGYSLNIGERAAKVLETLIEMVPGRPAAAIAVLYSADNPGGSAPQVAATLSAAAALGAEVTPVLAEGTDDWDAILARLNAEGFKALIFTSEITYTNNLPAIMEALRRHPLPSIFSNHAFPPAGGLMSFGTAGIPQEARIASFVDRILRGANPGDLPVEQPREYKLVINRRTADALGLTIPDSLLLRATEIIE
jgi:putative ABC transport system substrate-binding protein